jgi:hypothetical protein
MEHFSTAYVPEIPELTQKRKNVLKSMFFILLTELERSNLPPGELEYTRQS